MKHEAMNSFLSHENIEIHRNYLKSLRLKLSIIRKSYPGCMYENLPYEKRRIDRNIPDIVLSEARDLVFQIKMHETYFCSFTDKKEKANLIRKQFSSEEAFFYEIYDMIKSEKYGYLIVYIDEKGRIKFSVVDVLLIAIKYKPILVIDLFEHSYFYDYLYDKDSYYKRAIERLDLGKIEEALTSS